MNMRINPNKVIEDRLAASFGLEQYGYIISQWKTVDVSADEDFQTKFNGYYRVQRNAEWRECYYALFQRGKHRLTRAHREKQLKMSCQALHNAPPNRT